MPTGSPLSPKRLPAFVRPYGAILLLVFALFLLTGLLSAQQSTSETTAVQERFQSPFFPSLESLVPIATAEIAPDQAEEAPPLVYQQQELYVQDQLSTPTEDSIAQAKANIQAQLDSIDSTTAPLPMPGSDSQVAVSLLRSATGTVETLSMDTYLWGVLSAEMPASFPLEALKAQAVSARSYTAQSLQSPKHSQAQLCDSPACCQAYEEVSQRLSTWGSNAGFYQEKISSAIAETDGLYVLYDGQPINALFFSSSWGQTLPSQEVWGGTVPYLVSVSSPEANSDVPNFHAQVHFSAQEVAERLLAHYPALDLSQSPDTWFSQRVSDSVGGVGQYTVGGVTLTGTQIRAVFALRSTYFSIYYNEGEFTFSTTGYGHNVGMSQYGAKAMAESGYHFGQILTWYYTGTSVQGYLP